MEIHNISEDIVINSVEEIIDSIKEKSNPDKLCLCDQCKLDTVCYALNRVEPRYVVSNRGITRLEQDWAGRQQNKADIATLVYKGLRLVNHNQRPTADHGTSISEDKTPNFPAFSIPTIVGRLFNGETFAPVTDAVVELYCGSEIVPMRNRNWQNPFALVKNTPGTFTFWPASVPTDLLDTQRTFEYSLKIKSPQYETMTHFFKVSVASKVQALYSHSPDKTFKLPDLYLFPPGEAEQNG